MNKFKFLLVVTAISCLPLLNCCVKDPPPVVEEPEPDLTETVLRFLKSIDTYDIGEHSCMVETSTDSYEYQYTLADTNYYYLSPTEKTNNNRVPVGLTDTISTLGLMETILENPVWYHTTMWGEYYISNFLSTDGGFLCLFENLNPGLLDEFYSKNDAVSLLVERYTNMYPTCSDNNYSSAYGNGDYFGLKRSTVFMEIQLLMAEDTILNRLTEEELREVSVHIVKTYISRTEDIGVDIFALNLYSLAWLATRIMETNDYQPFYRLYGEWQDIYRATFGKFIPVHPDVYAILMLCFNNFIQQEL